MSEENQRILGNAKSTSPTGTGDDPQLCEGMLSNAPSYFRVEAYVARCRTLEHDLARASRRWHIALEARDRRLKTRGKRPPAPRTPVVPAGAPKPAPRESSGSPEVTAMPVTAEGWKVIGHLYLGDILGYATLIAVPTAPVLPDLVRLDMDAAWLRVAERHVRDARAEVEEIRRQILKLEGFVRGEIARHHMGLAANRQALGLDAWADESLQTAQAETVKQLRAVARKQGEKRKRTDDDIKELVDGIALAQMALNEEDANEIIPELAASLADDIRTKDLHFGVPEPVTQRTYVLKPPAAAPADPARTHVVKQGDTLSGIAKLYYGDMHAWPRIRDANRGLIKDPDLIEPGWRLRIPPKPGRK